MALVQAVILFGSETWVMTPRLEKSLEGFRHWAVWHMAGMVSKRQQDGTWLYKTIGALLTMVGLEIFGMYISRSQNTVAQYIATHPIMEFCLLAERNLGLRLYR